MDTSRVTKLLALLECKNGTLREHASTAIVDQCRLHGDDDGQTALNELFISLVRVTHSRQWPARTTGASTLHACLLRLRADARLVTHASLPLHEVDIEHVLDVAQPLLAQDSHEFAESVRGPTLMSARQHRRQLARIVEMEERTGVSTRHIVADDELVAVVEDTAPSTSTLVDKSAAIDMVRSSATRATLYSSVLSLLQCTLMAADWETRHGSALALVNVIGAGGGDDELLMSTVHTLAHVLVADRFTDFSTATCIAPVRETAAQLLAVCLRESIALVDDWTEEMVAALGRHGNAWETRQSAFLVVKYVSAWNAALAVRLLPLLMSRLTPVDGHDELAAATAADALHALVVLDRLDDHHSTRTAVIQALEWYTRGPSEEGVTDPSAVIVHLLDILERVGDLPQSFAAIVRVLYAHADANVRRMAARAARALPSMDAALLVATYVLLLTDSSDEVVAACARAPSVEWTTEASTITLVGMLNAPIVDPHNPAIDPPTLASLSSNGAHSGYLCGEYIRSLDDHQRPVHVARRQFFAAHFLAPLLARSLDGACECHPDLVDEGACHEADASTLTEWLVTGIESRRACVRLWCLFVGHALDAMGHEMPVAHKTCTTLLPNAARTVYEETSAMYARVNRSCIEFVARCIATTPTATPPKSVNITRVDDGILMCETLLDKVNQTTDRSTYVALHTEMSALRSNALAVAAVVTPLHTRAHALLAATVALHYSERDSASLKLTPVIKPVMTALVDETVPTCVEMYAEGVARLARHLAEHTPAALVKIARNLASMLTGDDRSAVNARVTSRALFARNDALRARLVDALMTWTETAEVCQARALFLGTVVDMLEIECLVEIVPRLMASSREYLSVSACVRAMGVLLCECTMQTTALPSLLRAVLGGNEHLLLGVLDGRQHDHGLERLALEWLHLSLTSDAPEKLAPYTSLFFPFALSHVSNADTSWRSMANVVFGELVVLSSLAVVASSLDVDIDRVRDANEHMVTVLGNPRRLPHVELAELGDGVTLRPYQVEGVTWLVFLQRYNLHGLLGDDMGLGKTLQTLVAIHHSLNGRADTISLVVCPRTLIGHWVSECRKYFLDSPLLRPIGVESVNDLPMLEGNVTPSLFVTSYEMVRRHESRLCAREYHYAVLDEGHTIRNSKGAVFKAVTQLRARHRVILSGTPVQNNVTDLWSLMHWLMPDYLGTWTTFNAHYARPILLARDAKTESALAKEGDAKLSMLHKRVLPFTLRRLKEDVLAELPDKIVTDIYASMTECQRTLYENVSEHAVVSLAEGAERVSPLQVLTYLRKVCNHPHLVDTTLATDVALSGKMLALHQLLVDCGIARDHDDGDDDGDRPAGHRALIFCQYKSTVQLVADYFDGDACMYGVNYARLDGSVPAGRRHDIAEAFNRDSSVNVLLLTTQIGGVGLNLTGADTVVMLEHDFNPARDMQAIDRAHRLGQKKVVNVYRLITERSIEATVVRLQGVKRREAGIVIGTSNSSMTSMATEQLIQLLSNPEHEGGSKKRARVESSLERLWDENEYEDAFNVEAFVKQITRT